MRKAAALALLLVLLSATCAYAETYYEYSAIPTNGSIIYGIAGDSSVIRFIQFSTDSTDRVRIAVRQSDAPDGSIYRNVSIASSGLTDSPAGVLIGFSVDAAWINGSDIDEGSVRLHLYDGQWTELATERLASDEGHIYFSALSPDLDGYYAVSGSRVPLSVTISLGCNENGVCEPEAGETADSCPDCLRKARPVCEPGKDTCLGDYLFRCSDDGESYGLERCDRGCSADRCIGTGTAVPTGMGIYDNPAEISLVIGLVIIIALLLVALRRERDRFNRMAGGLKAKSMVGRGY